MKKLALQMEVLSPPFHFFRLLRKGHECLQADYRSASVDAQLKRASSFCISQVPVGGQDQVSCNKGLTPLLMFDHR